MAEDIEMPNVLAEPVAGDVGLEHVDEDEAARRINLSITPNDAAWSYVRRQFQTLLAEPNKTVGEILVENFTEHEARLFIPSERGDIRNVQQDNTERYYALLEGRFRDATRDLATKLTMMFFGLPVEPMITPIDELYSELETREPEGQRYAIDPPLHFLTAHNRRNWGRDCMRGREAIAYPIILDPQQQEQQEQQQQQHQQGGQQTAALRGGKTGDGHGGDNEGGNDDDSDDSDDNDDGVDYVLDDEDEVTRMDDQCILFGFQGSIPFAPRKWKTYARAVRQLLSIRFKDDAPYSYSLVHFDAKANTVIATTHDRLPLTENSPSMRYLQSHVRAVRWHKDCCAFFVMFRGETVPWTYRPIPAQLGRDVGRLFLEPGMNSKEGKPTREAYIAFPKVGPHFEAGEFAANQYNARFRAAVDVLIGCPEDSFHRAIVSVYDMRKTSPEMHSVYGAMSQPASVWHQIYPLANKIVEPGVRVRRMAYTEIALVLPNWQPPEYIQTVLRRSSYGDAKELCRTIMQDAFLGEVTSNMSAILVLPGSASLGRDVKRDIGGYVIPIDEDEEVEGQGEMPKLMEELVRNDQEPFLVLHPVWKENLACLWAGWDKKTGSKQAHTKLPEWDSSLADMRKAVTLLVDNTNHRPRYDAKRHYLVFRQKPSITGEDPYPFIPKFVVTPETTENEWFRIRLNLICYNVVVDVVMKRDIDWESRIPKSVVWGPRYQFKPREPDTELSVLPIKTVAFDKAIPKDADDPKTVFPKSPTTKLAPPSKGLGTEREAASERSRTWDMQPSIFDGTILYPSCIKPPRVPINAPPAEHVFRTTSSLPMYSKAILTPTEQVNLQQAFWDLRNVILSRVNPCPYTDCKFVCRMDNRQEMEDHVRIEHQVDVCHFCSKPMPQWWTPEQKLRHTTTKHRKKLTAFLNKSGGYGDGEELPHILDRRTGKATVTSELEPKAKYQKMIGAEDKPDYYFCDRCGRDIRLFSSSYEREHHDRTCVHDLRGFWHRFCTRCGGRQWDSEEPAAAAGFESEYPHVCPRGDDNDDDDGGDDDRYCAGCGIDKEPMSEKHREHHAGTCKSFGCMTASFCNWCGMEFAENSTVAALSENMQHMRRCYRGLDEAKVKPFESPWTRLARTFPGGQIPESQMWRWDDPMPPILPHILLGPLRAPGALRDSSQEKNWYDDHGPRQVDDPVTECYMPDCRCKDLSELDPAQLFQHFQVEHPKLGNECPFCKLSFCEDEEMTDGEPRRRPEHEILLHLGCHIYCLWDRASVNEGKYYVDFSSVPGRDDPGRREKRSFRHRPKGPSAASVLCPLSSTCGQPIDRMSREDMINHLRFAHKEELLFDAFESQKMIQSIVQDIRDELQLKPRGSKVNESKGKGVGEEDGDADDEEEESLVQIEDARPSDSGHHKIVKKRQQVWKEIAQKLKAVAPQPGPNDEELSALDLALKQITGILSSLPIGKGEGEEMKKKKKKKDDQDSLASGDLLPSQGSNDEEEKGEEVEAVEEVGEEEKGEEGKEVEEEEEVEEEGKGDIDLPSGSKKQPKPKPQPKPKDTKRKKDSSDDQDSSSPNKKAKLDSPTVETIMLSPSRFQRRPPSPDWDELLGPEDPAFEPPDGAYCSRCLRKAFKRGNKSPSGSKMDRDVELSFHSDPARSCRTRRGMGRVDDRFPLPNRSGWIDNATFHQMKKSSTGGNSIKELKAGFLAKYPGYELSLYPTLPNHGQLSRWESDPNNETNRAAWGLHWPPYEGPPPFPGWSTDLERPRDGSQRRRKRQEYKGLQEFDPTYRPADHPPTPPELSESSPEPSDASSQGRPNMGKKAKAKAKAKKPAETPVKKRPANTPQPPPSASSKATRSQTKSMTGSATASPLAVGSGSSTPGHSAPLTPTPNSSKRRKDAPKKTPGKRKRK